MAGWYDDLYNNYGKKTQDIGNPWLGTYPGKDANKYGNEIGSGAPSYLRIDNSGKVTDTRDWPTYTPSNDDNGGNRTTASTGGFDWFSQWQAEMARLRAQGEAVWNKWLKQRNTENADYRRKVTDQANISKLQTAKGLRQTPNSGPKLSRYVQSNLGHLNTIAEAKREENRANQNDAITAQQGKLGLSTQITNMQNQWLPYLIQNGYTGSLKL